MPLVAHNDLPTFTKLEQEGLFVLSSEVAREQDIRELHIGLLNMMPDAALVATERQFFRLVGESNPIAQFFVHPFSLKELQRGEEASAYVERYYENFEQIKQQGLDALIITGINVIGSELSDQPFWQPLIEVTEWAYENVTSTLCSCLATHAMMEFRYGQKRVARSSKKWGVFQHRVTDSSHPLVADINSRFDVPHSRWNSIHAEQFESAGLKILASGEGDCVQLVTSADGFRVVFFQGHPEYDTVSLLKEYKRDVNLYISGEIDRYPCMPENYFGMFEAALLREHQARVDDSLAQNTALPEFPEDLILGKLDNTWRDTASAVVGRWMGLVYQVTDIERGKPFMAGVDPDNPLGLA
jgi:homoserine O-succinyltransferase